MKTVFILHGGETSRDSKENDNFFAQVTAYIEKSEVKILMCYWARERNEWDKLIERDTVKIQRATNKKVTISIAQNENDLFQKMPKNDVLYVAGGHVHLIEPMLPKMSSLKSMLEDKVYVGSSMGAFIVAQQYVLSFSEEENKIYNGLGIIPLNILCHWNIEKEKDKKISILKDKNPNVPILFLDEEKFSVFYH